MYVEREFNVKIYREKNMDFLQFALPNLQAVDPPSFFADLDPAKKIVKITV